jgi:hypothetical protein
MDPLYKAGARGLPLHDLGVWQGKINNGAGIADIDRHTLDINNPSSIKGACST